MIAAVMVLALLGPGIARPLHTNPPIRRSGPEPARDPPPVRVLIVTGVSGEPRFATEFSTQARSLISSLGKSGVTTDRITWLAESDGAQVAGRATRERVEQELVRLSAGDSSEQVLLVFIGHGSDAGEPMLNLPGPISGQVKLIRSQRQRTHLPRRSPPSVSTAPQGM